VDQRGIDREVTRLKREEQKCEAAIKAAAKKPGGTENAKALARSLLQIRSQIERLSKVSSRVGSAAMSVQMAGTTATLAGTMASTAAVMGNLNKQMDQQNVAQVMHQFSQQQDEMELKEQVMDDAFECLDNDADWEAEDETLSMVMDELGLEVAEQMKQAPKGAAAASEVHASRRLAATEVDVATTSA